MNKNSMNLAREFKEKFITGENLKVLDIGSMIVKRQGRIGTYRDVFSGHDYIGADLADGPNVDLVLAEEYKLPFPDETFDVVISGQLFEHLKFPWIMIEEMARVTKKGGHVCVIAPFIVHVHYYPLDCYRFLPQGLSALAEYAKLETLWTKVSPTEEWGKHEEDVIIVAKK